LSLFLGCASQATQPDTGLDSNLTQRPAPILVASADPLDETPANPQDERDADAAMLMEDERDADAALLLEDDSDAPENKEDGYSVADPIEPFNRAMFYFNDKLYFWVFKPIASGYRTVTPKTMRVGIQNFFTNLLAPIRVVNNILQGDGEAAEAEFAKFVYNTTVGGLGFGNPSKSYPALNPDPEDLGQTLGSYGIGDGFYIVWPILGPSTLRDTIGDVGDGFLNPVNYVEPIETYLTVQTVNIVNDLSFQIGDYETLKKASLDPYASMRNFYIQLRQSRIKK
jgi:phospholipid-binding lipoprotein MlaA